MSAQDIIFNIGIEGSWTLLPPFANAVRANARYTVRAVRTFSSIIADGDDPRVVYDKYNVPEADYIRDLQLDVPIISLQATTGEFEHIPQSYIDSYPRMSGVSYRPLSLVVPISSVPDDVDLANLIAKIQVAVLAELGVNTQPSITALGAAELISQEDHQRIVNARNALKTTGESPAAITVRLEADNVKLREQNKMLQDQIKKLI